METRLQQQLAFLVEVDKMKTILRRTLLMDGSRRENDAEHSWHFALAALLLQEYAGDGVDMFRVLKMALIHDLVEIYAGDTYAFDEEGNLDKALREQQAADQLFCMLPAEQNVALRSLWEEFDAMATPDSRYAAAIDRLQPFLSNWQTGGRSWKEHGVCKNQIYRRMDMVRQALPALWPFVEEVVREAVNNGTVLP